MRTVGQGWRASPSGRFRTGRRRGLQAGIVAGAVVGGLLVAAPPAAAHNATICSSMGTAGVGVLSSGQIRQLPSAAHQHRILWSFQVADRCPVSFPAGGSLNVRVRFLQRDSSGGCTSNPVSDGRLAVFTGADRRLLVDDVLPSTCYRLIWRPNNAATANRTLRGALVIQAE
jgi:hypothetical protein